MRWDEMRWFSFWSGCFLDVSLWYEMLPEVLWMHPTERRPRGRPWSSRRDLGCCIQQYLELPKADPLHTVTGQVCGSDSKDLNFSLNSPLSFFTQLFLSVFVSTNDCNIINAFMERFFSMLNSDLWLQEKLTKISLAISYQFIICSWTASWEILNKFF